jgi:hypothetical protein
VFFKYVDLTLVIVLAREAEVNLNEPDISDAICLELDNKVGLFRISAKSVDMLEILEAKEADTLVNEPDI